MLFGGSGTEGHSKFWKCGVNLMRSRNAFTLIELLIVVAIIGILAAIAVPNFMNARVRATLARVQSDMRALGTAVEMYAIDQSAYPCDGQTADCSMPWWANAWRLSTPIAYIGRIPQDPFVIGSPFNIGTPTGWYWYADYFGYGLARNQGRPVNVGSRRNVRLFDSPRGEFRFVFISPAPDNCWEWDRLGNIAECRQQAPFAGDVLYYNSSNGLRSQGDLYLYGSGNAFNPPSSFR